MVRTSSRVRRIGFGARVVSGCVVMIRRLRSTRRPTRGARAGDSSRRPPPHESTATKSDHGTTSKGPLRAAGPEGMGGRGRAGPPRRGMDSAGRCRQPPGGRCRPPRRSRRPGPPRGPGNSPRGSPRASRSPARAAARGRLPGERRARREVPPVGRVSGRPSKKYPLPTPGNRPYSPYRPFLGPFSRVLGDGCRGNRPFWGRLPGYRPSERSRFSQGKPP